jgi:D-alanine-D-alanine ligase
MKILGASPRQYGRIGVLMGGVSGERDVSLKSGKEIWQALHDAGCDVIALDITNADHRVVADLLRSSRLDMVLNVLHGRFGEDGEIQEVLNALEISFPGSGVAASEVSFHKIMTQRVLRERCIPVPSFSVVDRGQEDVISFLQDQERELPLVIKPDDSGSSLGVSIARNWSDCVTACQNALLISNAVIVEQCIQGREMTVGILEDEALPVIEICSENTFFDFEAKYQNGLTDYRVPAPISARLKDELQSLALKVYHILGCEDFARVDFMVDPLERPYVLEINTLPGFTPTSLLPKAAAAAGISFQELCLRMVEIAHGKKKTKNPSVSIV